jgi:PKD repeat protein
MTWLSGWQCRKAVPIAGGSEAVAGYPVPLTVHYGAGTDAPGHVYLGTKGQADFADLRFCAADGSTALPYWVESKVDGDQALVWVRVDTIPVSPGAGQVYAYYGNATAASASDGETVFEWFSHFDASEDARLTASYSHPGGTVTYANGKMSLTSPGAGMDAYLLSTQAYGVGYALRHHSQYPSGKYGLAGWADSTSLAAAAYMTNNGDAANPGQAQNRRTAWQTQLFAPVTAFGSWDTYEITRPTTSMLRYYASGNLMASSTTAENIPNGDLWIFYKVTGSYTIPSDWLLVRKCIDTEPTASTAGAEETLDVPYLSASFTVTPAAPPLPLTVQFTDTSAASNTTIESWLWDFGDGTTSTAQHPSHTFPDDESERTVTLTIAAELGTLTSVATLIMRPNDGIGRAIGLLGNGPVSGSIWTGAMDWSKRHDAAVSGALIASDGPAIDRGGLGRQVGAMIAVPEAAENYWDAPHQAVHPGTKVGGRINWISPDREMLGVSVPGRFIVSYDGAAVAGEAYHLTQHKPWEGHVDNIDLSAETYALTVIAGWGSTPPRHVSAVRYAEGVLIEWDPPADLGSSGLIDEYRIYRGPDLGSVTQVASVSGDARHWLDADAPSPAVYIVAAFNRIIESDPTTAVDIVDPDTEHLSLRDALSGASWAGLPYAGWMGVRAIRLAPAGTFVLRPRAVRPIVPTIFPADATVQALAWSSDREDIATVDAAGVVRAISPGRAVIYATATDGTEEYASVPVIVAPAFMTDDMREYLMTAGFERVFTRAMPDALDRSITLLQGAGTAPDLALELDRPVLRVLIVAPDLREAEETRKRVHDALHGAGPLDIGGVRYLALEALSSGEYVEKTRRGPRYVCTLTFMIEKERTLHIVSDPVRANEIVGRSP